MKKTYTFDPDPGYELVVPVGQEFPIYRITNEWFSPTHMIYFGYSPLLIGVVVMLVTIVVWLIGFVRRKPTATSSTSAVNP